LLLLSRPDVQQDLHLSQSQAADAEQAIRDLYIRAATLRGKTGPPAVEGRKAIDEAQRAWFVANLSEEQQQRLVQVDLQWEGPTSLLSRPVVSDTLGLTPGQKTALAKAVGARDAARARGVYTRADEQALARQVLSVLTATQKERWRAMLGRPFAFTPLLATGDDPATIKR
jgi:hypothetical protein